MAEKFEILAIVRPPFWALSAMVAFLGCGPQNSPAIAAPRQELRSLELTEIHYHPLDEGTVSGDEYEFIELKNTGASVLSLANVALTQGIDYAFPASTTLAPAQFLVVASNAAAFQERYGFAPSGQYAGKLSNSGERITLYDLPAQTVITSVEYLDQSPWPAAADGLGRSLVPVAANLGDDPDRPAHWRTSFAIHGSPDRDDPSVAYINEILVHTDPPEKDSIEVFNPNDTPLDLSGWFLTDDKAHPLKYRIPAGTILAARGFGVFDADDFNSDPISPTSFALSEHGEAVYLVADSTGCAMGFCDGFAYGDMENGVAFGRHVTSTGEVHLVRLQTPTLGRENAPPASGPLIISEIMYSPPVGRHEYVELQNIGTADLPLFEPSAPGHTWKIDGLGFVFPPSITLAAGETVLVVSSAVSEAAFRQEYGVPEVVRIFAKTEELSDFGGVITLMKSWKPYEVGSQVISPFILEETVAFTNTVPWPPEANAIGAALHRKDQSAYGNDPASWQASAPTPGRGL
jgi:hypothetical protein